MAWRFRHPGARKATGLDDERMKITANANRLGHLLSVALRSCSWTNNTGADAVYHRVSSAAEVAGLKILRQRSDELQRRFTVGRREESLTPRPMSLPSGRRGRNRHHKTTLDNLSEQQDT